MAFPVPYFIEALPFNKAERAFGASRDGGKRKHAGCDVHAPSRSPVIAVEFGTIRHIQTFYNGNMAIEIDHGFPIATVRYAEIIAMPDLREGTVVHDGQVIGFIARVAEPAIPDIRPMLHFERYSGKKTGSLVVEGPEGGPYQRRSDLMDPTDLLLRLKARDLGDIRQSTVARQMKEEYTF